MESKSMLIRLMFLSAFVLVMGCTASGDAPASDSLSTRERDSAIGASRVPGAAGVTRAQRAADSADARNARLDSIANDP
jgi:hypothetical protein